LKSPVLYYFSVLRECILTSMKSTFLPFVFDFKKET
jgi:hypothetical protein